MKGTMQSDYAALDQLNIRDHGDAHEQSAWHRVAISLSHYESFWRTLIVLLTNRIVPVPTDRTTWIRLRDGMPRDYEQLAMQNYSVFQYASRAHDSLAEDRQALAEGRHPHPERFFSSLKSATEQAKSLRNLSLVLLFSLGIRWKFSKQPEDLYQIVGKYRNAFAHHPVLGRGVRQSRELLPPPDRLPDEGKSVLWSDIASIPESEMIDGLDLAQRLLDKFEVFIQKEWNDLSAAFMEARSKPKFQSDLALGPLLPIRIVFPTSVSAGLPGASGSIVLARSNVV
jgi:hypothetical protein